MSYSSTSNYGFNLPSESELMSDFETSLNANWDKIAAVPSAPSVTGTLPQAGSYDLYDRVYRTDDQSIYILVVKDANWGWCWRPVHAPISPWRKIPSLAFANVSWDNVSNDMSIAYDNRGRVHWRGGLIRSSSMLYNTTESIFKAMPKGLYPSRTVSYPLDVHPANLTTGFGQVQYGRLLLVGNDRPTLITGDSNITLQGGNSTGTQPTTIYADFHYSPGTKTFGTF